MSIPKNATQVFKGIIFDAYHWEQKMFDGSTKMFEMLKRKGSVQILPIIGNKTMIVRESQPNMPERYGLVGGQMNDTEKPLESAQREMKEETGFIAKNWELFRERTVSTKIDWTITTFIAKNCEKIVEPSPESGERIAPLLVSFDEFMEIILDPDFRSKDLTLDILTMHYKGQLEEFKKKLFG